MDQSVQVTSKERVTTLTSVIEISATKEEVWNTLKFPGRVEEFHPLIRKSFMTTDSLNRVGARRHCDLLPMGAMDEVITEWDEGNAFTIEVTGGKMLPPHRFMKGRFKLEALGAERTLVIFSFSYHLKYGFLGRLMDKWLVRPQFKKAPPRYVQGLKAYVEMKKAKHPSSSE